MSTVCKFAAILTVGFVMTGCAAHNYDFASMNTDRTRVAQLVEGLDRLRANDQTTDDELYDVSFAPLIHNHLHVFAQVEDEGSPAAYIESEFETCLPLFGFVNATVSQYDDNQRLLTRHDIDSNLWGAFREERELVVTPVGTREKTRHTVFWLIRWWDDEKWHAAIEVATADQTHP